MNIERKAVTIGVKTAAALKEKKKISKLAEDQDMTLRKAVGSILDALIDTEIYEMTKRGKLPIVAADYSAKSRFYEITSNVELISLALGIPEAFIFEKLAIDPKIIMDNSIKKASEVIRARPLILGIFHLMGKVQLMARRTGTIEGFDYNKWLGRWLMEPQPSLNGEIPANLLGTMSGQKMVENMLAAMEHGIYA